METEPQEPPMDNLVFIDEYPDLQKRVWLRRLHNQRHSGVIALPQVIRFPEQPDPDDAA